MAEQRRRQGGRPERRPERRPRSGERDAGTGTGRSAGQPGRSAGRSPGRSPGRGAGRTPQAGRDEGGTRSDAQQKYDGPPIPEQITGKELDRSVASQLKSLPDRLALRVARHLVAAGQVLADDPTTAYQHTLAARARASRLAVVREAVGEAAYAAGEYAEALQELRAARRMNGSSAYLAVMADCERALHRPDRALALLRNAPRDTMDAAARAEVTIVEAGARRDRGELEAALRTLEQAPLDSKSRAPWVARLRYAYADTLVDAGRTGDALAWFHRAEAVDAEQLTDAAERAAELEEHA